MESTACARKDRAQEQPLTPPEPGDRAPGTQGHRDFRDQTENTATPPRGSSSGWPGGPGVAKSRKNPKKHDFFEKKFKFCLDRIVRVNRSAVKVRKTFQNI